MQKAEALLGTGGSMDLREKLMKLNDLICIEKKSVKPRTTLLNIFNWVYFSKKSLFRKEVQSMSYWQYISGIICLYEIWPIEFFLLLFLPFFWYIDFFFKVEMSSFFLPVRREYLPGTKRKMIHLYLVIKVSSSFASVKPCQFVLKSEPQQVLGK